MCLSHELHVLLIVIRIAKTSKLIDLLPIKISISMVLGVKQYYIRNKKPFAKIK